MASPGKSDLAFDTYLNQGAQRSLRGTQREIASNPERYDFKRAPSLRTLENWSARHRWPDRIAKLEHQAQIEEEREQVERIKGYRARLRQEGLVLQQRGLVWLQDKEADDVKANEAIKAIVEGFRLEALGLGDATERVAVEGDYAHVLERLTDDELERLIETLRSGSGPGPAGASPSPTG